MRISALFAALLRVAASAQTRSSRVSVAPTIGLPGKLVAPTPILLASPGLAPSLSVSLTPAATRRSDSIIAQAAPAVAAPMPAAARSPRSTREFQSRRVARRQPIVRLRRSDGGPGHRGPAHRRRAFRAVGGRQNRHPCGADLRRRRLAVARRARRRSHGFERPQGGANERRRLPRDPRGSPRRRARRPDARRRRGRARDHVAGRARRARPHPRRQAARRQHPPRARGVAGLRSGDGDRRVKGHARGDRRRRQAFRLAGRGFRRAGRNAEAEPDPGAPGRHRFAKGESASRGSRRLRLGRRARKHLRLAAHREVPEPRPAAARRPDPAGPR